MNKIWEIAFVLENGQTLICLEEANSGQAAYESIMSVWGPPSPIVTFSVAERHFFQIHIPSLER